MDGLGVVYEPDDVLDAVPPPQQQQAAPQQQHQQAPSGLPEDDDDVRALAVEPDDGLAAVNAQGADTSAGSAATTGDPAAQYDAYQQQQQAQYQQYNAGGYGDYSQQQQQPPQYGGGYGGYSGGGGGGGGSHSQSGDGDRSGPQPGKLFIGGISWETTEDSLRAHFSKYGALTDAALMKDKYTGQPRGFGFVTFADSSAIDRVLDETHMLDGRDRNNSSVYGARGSGGTYGESKKIFVGGLAPSVTEQDFRRYFEEYGRTTDAVVMFDRDTQRSRGFGFVTFEEEGAVAEVISKTHEIHGKTVEIKRAEPKEARPGGGYGGGGGGYGGRGGGRGGYGGGGGGWRGGGGGGGGGYGG
ncbi:hypothetical protein PybrP1_006383, partial [[Pythium] brassicae (nom. inval.)]